MAFFARQLQLAPIFAELFAERVQLLASLRPFFSPRSDLGVEFGLLLLTHLRDLGFPIADLLGQLLTTETRGDLPPDPEPEGLALALGLDLLRLLADGLGHIACRDPGLLGRRQSLVELGLVDALFPGLVHDQGKVDHHQDVVCEGLLLARFLGLGPFLWRRRTGRERHHSQGKGHQQGLENRAFHRGDTSTGGPYLKSTLEALVSLKPRALRHRERPFSPPSSSPFRFSGIFFLTLSRPTLFPLSSPSDVVGRALRAASIELVRW